MKNYLIIGGSSGIGRCLADLLQNSGHQVYATFNQNACPDSDGLNYHFLDVTADQIDLSFIPDRLDGVAYCPGSIDLRPFRRFSADDFRKDYELQVIGAVKVLQQVVRQLKASKNPSVVLFSTVAVQQGFNFHSLVSASKGALEGLTRSLAAEFAPSIRVNAIAPSLTDTPLAGSFLGTEAKKEANAQRHPMKRTGKPEDIAEMAAFLLSERSSWITGQVLHVDGGISRLK